MEYIIAFVFSLALIYKSQKLKLGLYAYFISVLPVILIAALRTIDIGVDTRVYVRPTFRLAQSVSTLNKLLAWSGQEKLYLVLAFILTRITRNFNEYLFYEHSLMYGFLAFALFQVRKTISVWMGLFIFLFVFYRESLNIARQSFALYIDLIAFVYLLKNNYKVSLLFVVLAYGFHHSSILFLSVVLLKFLIDRFKRVFVKRRSKIIIITSLILVFSTFAYVVTYLESLGLVDTKYVERYAQEGTHGTNLPISNLMFCVVNLVILYLAKYKRLLNKSDKYLIFFEYILIMALICCFTGLISTFTVRIGMYFWYMTIIIIPIIIKKYLKSSLLRNLILAFYVLYWILTVVVANLSATYPYNFRK